MYKFLCLAVVLLAAFTFTSGSKPADASAASSFPRIVGKVALKNQTENMPVTTIFNVSKTGLYRFSAYLVNATPTSTGPEIWGLNLGWTDDVGAEQAQQLISIDSTSIPPNAYAISPDAALSNVGCFRAVAGTPVTFWVNGGTGIGGAYDVFITIEDVD